MRLLLGIMVFVIAVALGWFLDRVEQVVNPPLYFLLGAVGGAVSGWILSWPD